MADRDPIAWLRELLASLADRRVPLCAAPPLSPGAVRDSRCGYCAPCRARRVLAVAPELLAVVEATDSFAGSGHHDWCDTHWYERPCSCGLAEAKGALEALDAAAERARSER